MANEKRLIDADALMEILTRCIDQTRGALRSMFMVIKHMVNQMPTVDAVEVVHGRWIVDNGYIWSVIRCSKCTHWFQVPNTTADKNEYRYCPFCGAKMDGDGNG